MGMIPIKVNKVDGCVPWWSRYAMPTRALDAGRNFWERCQVLCVMLSSSTGPRTISKRWCLARNDNMQSSRTSKTHFFSKISQEIAALRDGAPSSSWHFCK